MSQHHGEDFADLLGRFQLRAGLTQQDLAREIGVHRNTVVKWMNRSSPPTSRGQVLRLADALFLTKDERKTLLEVAGFPPSRWPIELWIMPYQRDPFFVGREEELQSLRSLLLPGNTATLTQAISGLGGIGKTHMSIEYVYRFQKEYEAVLWLQADSREILVAECRRLAPELGIREREKTDQIVQDVQRWLREHHRWLLILDNAENPEEIIREFVPTNHRGSVLVTTRVQHVEPLAQTQVLSVFSEQEGVLFLLRRTKILAFNVGLEQMDTVQYNEARQIWHIMGGLPLALDQAGAYILETGCTFSSYYEAYTRRRAELLRRRGKRYVGHEMSVATTFSLAFGKIQERNALAANILRMCSLLYGEAIPEELFREGVVLSNLASTSSDDLNEALGILQDYSIVYRNRDIENISVHRLVQEVLQGEMGVAGQQEWSKHVVLAVRLTFPSVEFDEEHSTWPVCERLLPQALLAATYIQQYHLVSEDVGRLLQEIASYLRPRGEYQKAEIGRAHV